jgi:predicted NACHT family NTPase
LLKEQAHGWHGFLHLTLQEYFVAQYALDHAQLDTLLTNRGDPWWEEVILLYAGQAPDASPLLQKLLGQDTNFLLREDILYHLNIAGQRSPDLKLTDRVY